MAKEGVRLPLVDQEGNDNEVDTKVKPDNKQWKVDYK